MGWGAVSGGLARLEHVTALYIDCRTQLRSQVRTGFAVICQSILIRPPIRRHFNRSRKISLHNLDVTRLPLTDPPHLLLLLLPQPSLFPLRSVLLTAHQNQIIQIYFFDGGLVSDVARLLQGTWRVHFLDRAAYFLWLIFGLREWFLRICIPFALLFFDKIKLFLRHNLFILRRKISIQKAWIRGLLGVLEVGETEFAVELLFLEGCHFVLHCQAIEFKLRVLVEWFNAIYWNLTRTRDLSRLRSRIASKSYRETPFFILLIPTAPHFILHAILQLLGRWHHEGWGLHFGREGRTRWGLAGRVKGAVHGQPRPIHTNIYSSIIVFFSAPNNRVGRSKRLRAIELGLCGCLKK